MKITNKENFEAEYYLAEDPNQENENLLSFEKGYEPLENC